MDLKRFCSKRLVYQLFQTCAMACEYPSASGTLYHLVHQIVIHEMRMVRTRLFQRSATFANVDLKRFCSKRFEVQVFQACAMTCEYSPRLGPHVSSTAESKGQAMLLTRCVQCRATFVTIDRKRILSVTIASHIFQALPMVR